MLNGILWIAKSGAPWRDLPERFGPWQTVYERFTVWSNANVFENIFELLSNSADLQDLSIDSTSCKAHQHAAGAKKGLKIQRQTKESDCQGAEKTQKSMP
jgi:transposase